jgi:hypothetical protein
MRRVPSLTFCLDGDAPVPVRAGPHTAQRSFFQQARIRAKTRVADKQAEDGAETTLQACECGIPRHAPIAA